MSLISRIVLGLVKLALVIGLAGGLVDLIHAMREAPAKAHKEGIVSLKQFNSFLVGRGDPRSSNIR